MIDFKTHMEISKRFNDERGIDTYLSELNALERLEMTRAISSTYPIKESKEISEYIKENFNVTLNVMDAVLGQFIMLEQIITGKTRFKDENERDLAFAELIIRPKHHEVFDNEDPLDEQQNREKILSSPVQDIYNVVNHYLEDRDFVLFKQFSGVFYQVPDEDEEIEEEEQEKKTSEELFHSQWYWYSMVRMLAKEDIRRYDEIYMLKMSSVLPEMSYITQRDKIEKAQQKRQQALNEL